MLDRRVLHVIAGIAVAVMVLTWPARTDRILVRLIGIALIVAFVSSASGAIRASPRQWSLVVISGAATVRGDVLAVFPDRSIQAVGRMLAIVLVVVACRDLAIQLRRPRPDRTWHWPIAKATAGVAVASMLGAYPSALLAVATACIAGGWALLGAVALTQSLSTGTTAPGATRSRAT